MIVSYISCSKRAPSDDSRQQLLTSLSVLFDDVQQGAKNIEFRGCTWAQIGKPNHNSPNPFLCKPDPDLYPDKQKARENPFGVLSCIVLSCLVDVYYCMYQEGTA